MLVDELLAARRTTDNLFELLRPESLYERPVPERHRLIFYLGHLEAFDRNLLSDAARSDLDNLFAFGIDPPPGQLPKDLPNEWPTVEETRRYVAETRNIVDALFERVPPEFAHMALEHRLMHAETLCYLIHDLRPKYTLDSSYETAGETPPNPLVEVPLKQVSMGRSRTQEFAWDNESLPFQVEVPAFRCSRYPVTNGEYLQFVRQGAPPPHFWSEQNGTFYFRGMFDKVILPLDWPVFVTHVEAVRFARWRGLRLPTEAEYHTLPNKTRFTDRFDPAPVQFGLAGGWEWTSTTFAPFPGFRPHPSYPGYSANFFDGRHFVLKGGSLRTAARLFRRGFRNWFRPDFPYVYATFRLAE